MRQSWHRLSARKSTTDGGMLYLVSKTTTGCEFSARGCVYHCENWFARNRRSKQQKIVLLRATGCLLEKKMEIGEEKMVPDCTTRMNREHVSFVKRRILVQGSTRRLRSLYGLMRIEITLKDRLTGWIFCEDQCKSRLIRIFWFFALARWVLNCDVCIRV